MLQIVNRFLTNVSEDEAYQFAKSIEPYFDAVLQLFNLVAFDVKGKVNRLVAEKGRGKLVKGMEDSYAVIDSLVVCKFSRGTYVKGFDDLAALYTAVTGIDMSGEELRLAGERINNLGRLINIREGLTRKDDTVPDIYFEEQPLPPFQKLDRKVFDRWVSRYYELRGWDENGMPTRETLEEVGLNDVWEFISVAKLPRQSNGQEASNEWESHRPIQVCDFLEYSYVFLIWLAIYELLLIVFATCASWILLTIDERLHRRK
jgi:hypothetical protein